MNRNDKELALAGMILMLACMLIALGYEHRDINAKLDAICAQVECEVEP